MVGCQEELLQHYIMVAIFLPRLSAAGTNLFAIKDFVTINLLQQIQ